MQETKLLYLDDAYSTKCEGKVIFNEFTDLVVDQTVFFPTGHGQPNDRGKVVIDGKEYGIVDAWFDGTNVHLMSHDTFPDNIKGKPVYQEIDWDVRYGHMKFRTALRIVSAIAFRDLRATTRINQTYDTEAWIDIESDALDDSFVKALEAECNEIISKGLKTEYVWKSREEFIADQELMSQVRNRPPEGEKIRLVRIGDLPEQVEYGTVVRSTDELKSIRFKTSLVKGKLNKRLTLYVE
ncbi:alanyl-tRNA editing protein [Thermogymnomonas acidicola]|uniref:Alanyl-tRNA editing protein n=1 Tax=Thermogymnomonas acidicola TaxID=399579 RepID=A0AA37BSP7_9ARCH|nr:alanyl-tRNA editing protein [Thermogymnomonas acidicola]GGM77901.1 alanyl-tRNA editing protein [Thermogymnomonas acidicola]